MAGPDEPKPITSDVAGQTHKRSRRQKDELLDAAIEDTFPASDPPAITQPKQKVGSADEKTTAHVAPAPQINPAPEGDEGLRGSDADPRKGG